MMKEYGIKDSTVHKAIKYILNVSYEGDIIIFAGRQFSNEAFDQDDRMGNFYFLDDSLSKMAIYFGLGLALSARSRVFIVCDDSVLLNDFGAILQAAASKCENLYLFVVVSGTYYYSDYFPAISQLINGFKRILVGVGFTTSVLNNLIRIGYTYEDGKEAFYRVRGPSAGVFYVTNNIRNLDYDSEINKLDVKKRLGIILNDEELLLEPFTPPVTATAALGTHSLPTPPLFNSVEEIPGGIY